MGSTFSDWAFDKTLFRREEIQAKTVLLAEEKIAKRAYYIEKGCIRAWFNNGGKEVTFQFFERFQDYSLTTFYIVAQAVFYL